MLAEMSVCKFSTYWTEALQEKEGCTTYVVQGAGEAKEEVREGKEEKGAQGGGKGR